MIGRDNFLHIFHLERVMHKDQVRIVGWRADWAKWKQCKATKTPKGIVIEVYDKEETYACGINSPRCPEFFLIIDIPMEDHDQINTVNLSRIGFEKERPGRYVYDADVHVPWSEGYIVEVKMLEGAGYWRIMAIDSFDREHDVYNGRLETMSDLKMIMSLSDLMTDLF